MADRSELERKKQLYNALKKKTKRTKRFTILMFLMLFAVNAYAWFIYISESSFDLSAKIVSWDVNFLSESQEVSEIKEVIENVAPGMETYTKTVNINNNSDFDAEFNYFLTDFQIMGNTVLPSGYSSMTTAEILTYLEERYPFTFQMITDTDIIPTGDGGRFVISLGWDFEDASKYYKVDKIYKFNPSFDYYRYSNGAYVLDSTITAQNYIQHSSSLYLYKDDADSFFGMECQKYVDVTKQACVRYKAYLIVQQIDE
jgi:hypothetical protein